LRPIAAALLVLKYVEAYDPVSQRHAETYGSLRVFDTFGVDVHNGTYYKFEVESATPRIAALPSRDPFLQGNVRVRLHAIFLRCWWGDPAVALDRLLVAV
jgi:hypothetical protein